jgi:hypothetical protein
MPEKLPAEWVQGSTRQKLLDKVLQRIRFNGDGLAARVWIDGREIYPLRESVKRLEKETKGLFASSEKRKLLKVGDIYACSKCAEEHEQLAEWLQELKEYKELEEQGLLLKEEDVLKFYYCESLDKYLVGKRLDTMYYADITDMGDLHFFMSRYLPWGENTYPSEPKEIPFTEWLNGFTKQRELKEGAE